MASRVMWCSVCDSWFPYGDSWDGRCPSCGLTVTTFRCNRCDHTWAPLGSSVPRTCPKCHSPYWNRERARDPVTGEWYGESPRARQVRRLALESASPPAQDPQRTEDDISASEDTRP